MIKVLADYCSTGLWCLVDKYSIDTPTTLTRQALDVLEAWQAVYDQHGDLEDLDNSPSFDSLGRAVTALLNVSDSNTDNTYIYWKDVK